MDEGLGTSSKTEWFQKWAASHWVWMPLLLFLITRVGIALIAYLAAPLIADSTSPPLYHLRPPNNLLIDVFGSRWDTGFYVSIAEEGYFYLDVPLPSVAFFPLLPLMMRTLTPLVGDALIAGLVITNLALLLAMILFYRLVDEGWGQSTANRAVFYLLIFPTAFFGSAIYTESLFLLTAIGALYFARRGYWELSAMLGIAATLTKLLGLIVALMLFTEWFVQRRTKPDSERPSPLALLAPILTPLGTIAYMFYLGQTFGEPLAFIRGAAAWERVPQSPLVTVADLFKAPPEGWLSALLSGRIHIDNWLDFSMVLLFIILGAILLYNRQWSEGVFVLSGVLISISSGLLMSQRRYMWVLFPAFILLAKWGEKPWVDRLVTTLFLLGLSLLTALFANGYWVG